MPVAFEKYTASAGVPSGHVMKFQHICRQEKIVIVSRELNPLCTDLLLDGYDAKGFHIKAKTCDWGPMAGFVPDKPSYTKATQSIEKQEKEINNCKANGVKSTAIMISEQRILDLKNEHIIWETIGSTFDEKKVACKNSRTGQDEHFTLRRVDQLWAIYNAENSPVHGLINPGASTQDYKSAVCGDYDLWGIFPHHGQKHISVADRMMPLKATLPQNVHPNIKKIAAAGGFIFESKKQMAAIADSKEDAHSGNLTPYVSKIRNMINNTFRGAIKPVVMHSDYCGNPFGDIDFPLIFFIPNEHYRVANNIGELREQLHTLENKGYKVQSALNPSWRIPNYTIA
ncbi:hypothetical protein HQQ94_03845 [Shewanella sp. VB17]|uniref:anthrax toxin-like adenylyl cyclase domain-containing protein n=1 Tax=Shewanella sp. VB17 TaxID=2739432 RepID=UPI0015653183|nr:anthrax toxin-like adenylyl cyclase domain-containing protein [Shewanella sp. VB17]NRD72389.1 hypothetical protein [Shewanella sp. VB17]